MTRFRICSVMGFVLLLCVTTANAQTTFQANLDGLQEVPPNASPAFGSADFSLSGAILSIVAATGVYSDLLGNSTAVTLNDAAVGVNGPVISVLTLDSPGATTGTFSGSATLTVGQLADLIAGNTYVNIRSNVFPSGEIRGQLFVTPEPGSAALLALGSLSGLAVGWRRRKRSAA